MVTMMRLKKSVWIACVALILMMAQFANAAGMWEKGRHYKELPYPIKTADPDKIEVLKVFWYGCPHCYEFHNDHLVKWEKTLPDDVHYGLLPATFPGWVEHAKVFYAAEFLGVREQIHQKLFDAIVSNPKKYKSVDDLKFIFTEAGVSDEDLDKQFKASGFRKISKVDEAINKASDTVKKLRITGVPALVVNGKYMIGVRDAGNFDNMIKIANYLVNEERQAKKK